MSRPPGTVLNNRDPYNRGDLPNGLTTGDAYVWEPELRTAAQLREAGFGVVPTWPAWVAARFCPLCDGHGYADGCLVCTQPVLRNSRRRIAGLALRFAFFLACYLVGWWLS